MNAHDSNQCELLDQLAEEFAARYRRGERPPLKEYLDKYPELADDIRTLFPTLVEMEQIKDVPAAAATQVEPLPLRQIGDYRILREVGRGAMGVVYEAEQISLGRRVALKVLAAHIAPDRQSVERFRREARSAAKLHHTNIVPVFEVGREGDICYYAMQFIQGHSLDQILEELRRLRRAAHPNANETLAETCDLRESAFRRAEAEQLAQSLLTGCFQFDSEGVFVNVEGAGNTDAASHADASSSAVLPGQTELSSVRADRPHYFQSVARIGCQVAHALAHAHARGIIHRDIKPSNLLLDAAGVVWIADFGLAKTRDNSLTDTGDVVGTLRYMPPERFKGEGDERADVYALGLTLYEMLVLRPAFGGRDRLELIERIRNQEPTRPRSLDRRIPRDLETIILKAIDKEPKRRYQTAQEMDEDLRRFLEDQPIKARRTSQLDRVRLWSRRNPAVAALLAAVFVLLLCLTVGSIVAAYRLNVQRDALAEAEADRTEKLYQALVAEANASRFSRRVGQRFVTLEAVSKAAELVRERRMPAERLDALRTLAITALTLPDLRTLKTWEGLPGGSFHWDTDNLLCRYARTDLDGNISLRWIDTDEEIAHLQGWRGETWVHFSPGGRFLSARENGGRFRVWDVSGTSPQQIYEGEQQRPVFHPDDRHLLVRLSNGSHVLRDLTSAQEKLLSGTTPLTPCAFDAAGKRWVAFNTAQVALFEAATGKLLVSIPEGQTSDAAWHPSGNYLALVCAHRELRIWDLKRMRRMSVLKGCRNAGIRIAFTSDGERLLSSGWEDVVRVWDWRTGQQILQSAGGSNLRCRADGRLVIARDRRLHLVELTNGREYRSFVHQSNAGNDVQYWGASIHGGDRLVAVGMSDCNRFFDLETGEELGTMPFQGDSRLVFRFPAKDSLLSSGSAGLFRWPIREENNAPHCLHLGPPQLLHGGTTGNLDCSQKGEVLARTAGNGAYVMRRGQAMRFLGPQIDVRGIALHPSGKYAATGTHNGDEGVKVWDTETGRLIVHFPIGGMAGGVFSPDGQWLALRGSRSRKMVRVGTWEERPLTSGWPSLFSPDSSLLAVVDDRGILRLLATDSLRELVRLEDPNQDRPGSLAFTSDGGKLLVGSDDARAFHVWDLRSLRRQLAELGLDWDMPPLPAAAANAPPLQLQIDLGDYPQMVQAGLLVRQAAQQILARKHAEGLATLRKAVQIAPNHAMAHNNLAWQLLTGPDKLRDPALALTEARKAVALEPEQSIYHNTLGVALYRVGKYAEAIPVLERSLRDGNGLVDAFDLFFLAMCHHRLGDTPKAKAYRTRAVDWFAKHRTHLLPSWIEELTAFQNEADTLLGQPDKRIPQGNRSLPASTFVSQNR